MEKKTCCVTGHRPKGFPWDYDDTDCAAHQTYLLSMACQINELMETGYTHFISGGALGVDMDFADIVIGFRNTHYPDVVLEIAAPCVDQQKMWKPEDKKRYENILSQANLLTYISKPYTPWCMQQRNEYMVNCSDLVLAFWNGTKKGGTWNTISYSKKEMKTLQITNLVELSTFDQSDPFSPYIN